MSQTGFHVLRSFETTNGDLVLRRYMEKWKFLNLFTSKSLYFAPASQFLDNLEGHYTHLDETLSDQQARQWHFSRREMEMARNARASGVAHNQKAVVICCWTQGIEENPHMWSEYGGSSEAVALETTVARLRQSLGDSFLIVPVKYLDFSHKKIPRQHSLMPFFFKQNTFAWENEVRTIGEMEIGKRIGSPRFVPIDISAVFQRLILHPSASCSFRALIEQEVKNASVSIPVHDSSLR